MNGGQTSGSATCGTGSSCTRRPWASCSIGWPYAEWSSSPRILSTGAGGIVVAAPLAGPVRLRQADIDVRQLRRLCRALTDAIVLFGLEEYAK